MWAEVVLVTWLSLLLGWDTNSIRDFEGPIS
jgi:hypothetical protein